MLHPLKIWWASLLPLQNQPTVELAFLLIGIAEEHAVMKKTNQWYLAFFIVLPVPLPHYSFQVMEEKTYDQAEIEFDTIYIKKLYFIWIIHIRIIKNGHKKDS